MEIVFRPEALEDLQYWKAIGNTVVINKIRQFYSVTFRKLHIMVLANLSHLNTNYLVGGQEELRVNIE